MPKPFRLNRPLYTDKSKTLVLEEGDPKAAFVIGGAGSPVDDVDVEKYGLDESHQYVEEESAAPADGIARTGVDDPAPDASDADADDAAEEDEAETDAPAKPRRSKAGAKKPAPARKK